MSLSPEFQNRVVLVAGLSSNLGRATAQTFGREGAKLILADNNETNVIPVIESIQKNGGEATFEQTDLKSEKDVAALLDKIIKNYGRLDAAYNDASAIEETDPVKMLADVEENDWDRLIETHLKTIWICMKYELMNMRPRPGCTIVNSSSVLGRSGHAGHSVYSAAQHGVIGLTQAAARQYGPLGIRINAVCPALQAPVESVVDAIVWLSSSRSSFVSGQAIVITGGA